MTGLLVRSIAYLNNPGYPNNVTYLYQEHQSYFAQVAHPIEALGGAAL
jgi:hypothetical protein